MNWFGYSIAALISYGIFDFFVKQMGGKIHDGLGNLVLSIVPVVAMLIFIGFSYIKGDDIFAMKPGGLMYALLAGLAISFASIFFIKVFSSGANLSVGVPLVRVGMIMVSIVLAFIILKEAISVKQLAGFILAISGLFLLLAK